MYFFFLKNFFNLVTGSNFLVLLSMTLQPLKKATLFYASQYPCPVLNQTRILVVKYFFGRNKIYFVIINMNRFLRRIVKNKILWGSETNNNLFWKDVGIVNFIVCLGRRKILECCCLYILFRVLVYLNILRVLCCALHRNRFRTNSPPPPLTLLALFLFSIFPTTFPTWKPGVCTPCF